LWTQPLNKGDGIICSIFVKEDKQLPDRDFLEEIIKTEAEAARRLQDVREKSQVERQLARQKANELIEKAYSEAASIRQNALDEAERTYSQIVSESLSDTELGHDALYEDKLSHAADELAERIVCLLEHR